MKPMEIGSISLPYSLPEGTTCWCYGEKEPFPEHRHMIWRRYYSDGRTPELWVWSEDIQEWIPLELRNKRNKRNKTTMSPDEMIAVIAAHKQGKRIEYRTRGFNGPWFPSPNPEWDFRAYEFRIACEPRHAWFKQVQYALGECPKWEQCSKGDCGAVEFVEVAR